MKVLIVVLIALALCVACTEASAKSSRLHYSESSAVAPHFSRTASLDDLTPLWCISAIDLDNDFWLYNLCSCNLTAQFMITYDYYFAETLQVQTMNFQAWNGAPGGRYPNNAQLFSKDNQNDKEATLLAVVPEAGSSCNAPASYCIDVEQSWDNVADNYGYLLINKCSFPVKLLYICDSWETSLLKSYSGVLPNWDMRSTTAGQLPNNIIWSACSESNFDDGVIIISATTDQ